MNADKNKPDRGVFLDKYLQALPDLNGKKVLCALSGGPDSVALAHCLKTTRELLGFELCAAHLNHCLRPEADGEAEFVKNLCESWNIKCEVSKIDVKALSIREKISIELAARNARYEFLNSAADAFGCEYIALAHHMDDQAETFLLNAVRGTGLAGLRGMAAINGRYIRPLLGVRRRDIMELLHSEGLKYCIDASNDSDEHARNRLRKMMRDLECVHGNAIENISRTAALAARDEEALSLWTEKIWDEAYAKNALNIGAMDKQPQAIQTRLLKKLANSAGLDRDLYYRNIEDIRLLMSRQSGRAIDLPKGYMAKVEFGKIYIIKKTDCFNASPNSGRAEFGIPFERSERTESEMQSGRSVRTELEMQSGRFVRTESEMPSKGYGRAEFEMQSERYERTESDMPSKGYGRAEFEMQYERYERTESEMPSERYKRNELKMPSEGYERADFEKPFNICGENDLPNGRITCDIQKTPEKLGLGWPFQIEANPDVLDGAVIRRRKSGDRIHPLGAPGGKKFKDFCIDKKIPGDHRNDLLIASGNEILWFPGWVMSQRLSAEGCLNVAILSFEYN